jgi:hypothetical protein
MSRYPVRKRGDGYLPMLDISTVLEILK